MSDFRGSRGDGVLPEGQMTGEIDGARDAVGGCLDFSGPDCEYRSRDWAIADVGAIDTGERRTNHR